MKPLRPSSRPAGFCRAGQDRVREGDRERRPWGKVLARAGRALVGQWHTKAAAEAAPAPGTDAGKGSTLRTYARYRAHQAVGG